MVQYEFYGSQFLERTKPKYKETMPYGGIATQTSRATSSSVLYRLNAMDKRAPRNGRVIEELGWFDPIAPEDKQLSLKPDRIDYWLSVGAQPSRTVVSLLKRC